MNELTGQTRLTISLAFDLGVIFTLYVALMLRR